MGTTETVKKAYLEDISHFKAENKPNLGGLKITDVKIDNSMSIINIQAGQFNQTIPWTKEGIELAKGFLDLLATQLRAKEEEKPKEES